jgi:hypothetical protein
VIRYYVLLLSAVLIALASCGGGDVDQPDGDVPEAEVFEVTDSRSGNLSMGWRVVGDSIPLNEHFEIEVRVTTSTGAPVEDAQVSARCTMPEHGHGMNVMPRGRELGLGLYRVEGMLLHMRGRWVLGIDVIFDGLAETADFEILLE